MSLSFYTQLLSVILCLFLSLTFSLFLSIHAPECSIPRITSNHTHRLNIFQSQTQQLLYATKKWLQKETSWIWVIRVTAVTILLRLKRLGWDENAWQRQNTLAYYATKILQKFWCHHQNDHILCQHLSPLETDSLIWTRTFKGIKKETGADTINSFISIRSKT
jgi:hypothetical protein